MTRLIEIPKLWAPQQRGFDAVVQNIQQGRSVCLYGPTGSGKGTVAAALCAWALAQAKRVLFLINRRLLIAQTSLRFDEYGIPHGIRAAEFEDEFRPGEPIQISSPQTELARVYSSQKWDLTPADLLLVDEAHLCKSTTMKRIFADYPNAVKVGMTATPVGLSHMYDGLVISGTMEDYRECKAIVPARVFSGGYWDARKVKRNAIGEFVQGAGERQQYVQAIVGDVLKYYHAKNPDQRPTMLYAPCVKSSVWLSQKFNEAGHRWCHVDANHAVLDGETLTLTRELWQDISGQFAAGDIKGLSSRFRLREGIDMPSTYHCILATPIGSLASYIQTVGRVLRYSPETPDEVIVTDHGANMLRHLSPNMTRNWAEYWSLPERVVSRLVEEGMEEGEIAEPIRCPVCWGERMGGMKCPHCGYTHEKSKRHVIQLAGALYEEEVEGDILPKRKISAPPSAQKIWTGMFWGWRKSRMRRTFNQMRGYFNHLHGYYPPKDLDHTPILASDWSCFVCDVPNDRIRWP